MARCTSVCAFLLKTSDWPAHTNVQTHYTHPTYFSNILKNAPEKLFLSVCNRPQRRFSSGCRQLRSLQFEYSIFESQGRSKNRAPSVSFGQQVAHAQRSHK